MDIRELFSLEDENKALEDGFLTIRRSGDLRVYNYSDKAAISAESWENPAVLNSRGLIVDNYDLVVARPWKKFFNYNQPQAGELDYQAPVEVTDKADGSLGILFTWDGVRAGISTRGSLESDQALHAQKLLDTPDSLWEGYRQGDLKFYGDITPLVEIVYPGNRIILNYGDMDNLILLGGVLVESGRYVGPDYTAKAIGWLGLQTQTFEYSTLQEALEAPPRPNAEGLVIRFLLEDKLVKIKQADYVRMHRALFGMNELRIWEALMEGVPLLDLLEPLPDEVHEWVKNTYAEFDAATDEEFIRHLNEYECLQFELPEDYTRRDFAQAVMSKKDFVSTVLFNIEDGQNNKAWYILLKNLRPAGGGDRPTLEQAS